MSYIKKLSEKSKCVVYSYTNDSSSRIAKYLSRIYGITTEEDTTPDLRVTEWKEVSLLLSILYNAPIKEPGTILYQFYKESFNDFLYAYQNSNVLTPIRREEGNNSITVPVVFNSTTQDKEVLKYFSSFHDKKCCFRIIQLIHPFPILDVTMLSAYSFQKEVILPPFIMIKSENQQTFKINEYSEEDIKQCMGSTRTFPNLCPDEQRYDTRLNHDCFEDPLKTLKPVDLEGTTSNIITLVLRRDVPKYINKILNEKYNLILYKDPAKHIRADRIPKELHHHGVVHICNTITISIILFLNLADITNEINTREECERHLVITILSSLFHDVARIGEGEDKWEVQSSEMAVKELASSSDLNRSDIEKIKNNIISECSGNCLSYYAYKGADSIDISRVTQYIKDNNPFYIQYGHNSILANEGALDVEFKSLTSILTVIAVNDTTTFDDSFKEIVINIKYYEEEDNYTEFYDRDKPNNSDFFIENNVLKIKPGKKEIFATSLTYPTEPIDILATEEENVQNLQLKLVDFYTSIKAMSRHFVDNNYLKDPTRYFDDYWEILLAFLSLMPYTSKHLCKIIIPFVHRDLF